ncbi:MAG: hypothetical protein ACTHL8_27190 [Burkholderiaceae bacterium]
MQNQQETLSTVTVDQNLETPVVVEELAIEELAVREEYAACLTVK